MLCCTSSADICVPRHRLGKGGGPAGGPEAAGNEAAAQPKGMGLAAKLMEQMGWRGGGLGKSQQACIPATDSVRSCYLRKVLNLVSFGHLWLTLDRNITSC